MTTERKRRAHDLAKIKAHLKHIAEDTRALRDEARKLHGMDRWYKQREADENALTARCMGLAYGYLRGMSISQMESEYSDPDNVPDPGMVSIFAHAVFEKGPEGVAREDAPAEKKSGWQRALDAVDRWLRGNRSRPRTEGQHPAGWADFEDHVERDITNWKAKLAANRAARAAAQRVA